MASVSPCLSELRTGFLTSVYISRFNGSEFLCMAYLETYQELLDVYYNRVCTFFALLQLYLFVLKRCSRLLSCNALWRSMSELG